MPQRVEKSNYKFLHAGRLRESEINFVFCEWVLYDGTAPEQKTKSAKNGLDSMSKPFFNPSECNKLRPPSHLSVRSVLLHFVQRSPPETRTLCKGGKKGLFILFSAL